MSYPDREESLIRLSLATKRPDPEYGLLGHLPDPIANLISQFIRIELFTLQESYPWQFKHEPQWIKQVLDQAIAQGHITVPKGWLLETRYQ